MLLANDRQASTGATCNDLGSPFDAWRIAIGSERVVTDEHDVKQYGRSTIGVQRRILGVLRPSDSNDVRAIVRIAAAHRQPLYPVSTGRNWGYGSANPAVDGCVIVDMSDMDGISRFDPEIGIVTVEPGVTQQKLWDFLRGQGSQFLVPVHGGGPDCSILGNALERGYGLTPHADHFGAVTGIEAVLADGSIYRSPLEDLGGSAVSGTFKWGIGPYVDGLFSQCGMGIVTRATIALAPRAARVEGFCAWIDHDSDLEAVVVATRTILRSLGAIVGGINLMNAQRVLSMVAEYPHDKVGADQAMPRAILDQQCQRFDVAPWTVAGVLYGTPQIVRKARAEVRRQFQRVCRRIRFFHRSRIALLQRCVRCLPASLRMSKTRQLNSIDAFLNMAEGRPRRVALPLAYWRTRDRKDDSTFADPAADGCILMWYSPLTPMKPKAAREIVSIVQTVCTRHGIDPLVTLTSLSATAFDVTVPLLTGLAGKAGHERVAACYRELFEVGRNAGFLPYRVGIGQMNALTSLPCTYWDVVARLKSAMDEHSLLSPGRYSPAIGPFSNPTTSDLP